MNVAVLGASNNPARYSNKAVKMLKSHGHTVFPVNPAQKEVEGLAVFPTLRAIKEPVHTVTVYVGPANIAPLLDDIVAIKPERVIANPGAESEELTARLRQAGIPLVEACTLVMLSTKSF